MIIRRSTASDETALERLYAAAFPDEDLLPLVRDLLADGVAPLSLVAVRHRPLMGHVVLTRCGVPGRAEQVDLLGPLAVDPSGQRQGIGGALVREALRVSKADGTVQVQVLGDPAYYRRFGFRPDDDLAPPYRLPTGWRAAWQSLRLLDGRPPLQGTLAVPRPWRRPALWTL